MNLLTILLRSTLKGLLNFLDRVLPPLEPTTPLLRSAAPLTPEHQATTPTQTQTASIYISSDEPEPEPEPEPPVEPEPDITTIPDKFDGYEDYPFSDRIVAVEALLDEAYAQGRRTYAELIGYVEEKSSGGCSKRNVSDWKKERGIAQRKGAATEPQKKPRRLERVKRVA